MTKGMLIANKKAYVEDQLGDVLSVLPDFGSIKYAYDRITEQEYIRIADDIGSVVFVNVTASSAGELLKDVCRIVAGDNPPFGIILDTDTKRKIAPLFR